jgi:hypothetical protein
MWIEKTGGSSFGAGCLGTDSDPPAIRMSAGSDSREPRRAVRFSRLSKQNQTVIAARGGFVGHAEGLRTIDLVDAAVKNKDGNFLFTLRLR